MLAYCSLVTNASSTFDRLSTVSFIYLLCKIVLEVQHKEIKKKHGNIKLKIKND